MPVAIVQPGPHAGRSRGRADCRARSAEGRADLRRTSCSAPRISSPATTSSAAKPNQQKALQLAHAVVIHHDIKTADGEFDIFQNITPADVQRVARTYFRPENRADSHDSAVERIGPRADDEDCCAVIFAVAGGARARRPPRKRRAGRPKRPPRPLPAHEVQFPPYEIRTLDNGLQVVAVLHHEQPIVSMRMIVRAGAALDPRGKAGLADLAASLLDQGTTTRTANEMNDASTSSAARWAPGPAPI